MGQSKTNPNSILKKQGLIEPKKRNKTAFQRQIENERLFVKSFSGGAAIMHYINKTKENKKWK